MRKEDVLSFLCWRGAGVPASVFLWFAAAPAHANDGSSADQISFVTIIVVAIALSVLGLDLQLLPKRLDRKVALLFFAFLYVVAAAGSNPILPSISGKSLAAAGPLL